jgi:DNA-binding beta-propeller fold protein YncE
MGNWVESHRGGTKTRGMSPRALALLLLAVLLIVIAVLLYYLLVVLPKMGGGVVEDQKQKIGHLEFLFAVYGPGTGDKPYFVRPMGVATDSQGNMYVTDMQADRVCVFNKDGRYLFQFGGFGVAWPEVGYKATWKPGLFNLPDGIAIDHDRGDIYVADCMNQQIQVFNANGKFLRVMPPHPWTKIGKGGGGRGEGLYPTALTVKGDYVYVCDAYQIVIFKRDGTFVRQFGEPGRSPGHLDRPNGIAVGNDGTIYVSDSNHDRVIAYTNAGKLKWTAGTIPAGERDVEQTGSREFGLPRGLALDGRDNVFIADAFHFAIEAYDKNGHKLGEVGDRGTTPGLFNFPNDIAITNTGVAYVVDRANQRVQAVRIPGLITPPNIAGPWHFPWWVLLLLIPPLLVAYLLLRKPRFIADEPFLAELLAAGGGQLFDKKIRRARVTPEVLVATNALDERHVLADVLKETKPSEKTVDALVDEHGLEVEVAKTLAVARRSLVQRLLAVQVVLFAEDQDLRKVAEDLGAEVVDVETFLDVFAENPETPTPAPEAAGG